jgi:hypothetical protein
MIRMRSLSYHEAVPGHHFQLAIQQERTDLPKFRAQRIFGGGSAHSEGWGLYAERLAVEQGWYEGDVPGLLGALGSELFRARRLVVDTGLHTKGWTRQQAIDYGIGAQEVERYVVWPGQANAYMVGMLRILELREKAKRSWATKFSLPAFHDVVLKQRFGAAGRAGRDRPALGWRSRRRRLRAGRRLLLVQAVRHAQRQAVPGRAPVMDRIGLAPVERRPVADVVRVRRGAVAHDAHVAGRRRIERVEAGRGVVVGRRPMAGEQRTPGAGEAHAGVARGEGAGAHVRGQRAFDLEDGFQAAAQVFAAAEAQYGAVVHEAREAGAGRAVRVFEGDVEAAVDLHGAVWTQAIGLHCSVPAAIAFSAPDRAGSLRACRPAPAHFLEARQQTADALDGQPR